MLLLNPRRTRTNMKLLQLVWIFLLTLCGQSGITAMKVDEDDDAILDCSFGNTNIENKKFHWKKAEGNSEKDVFLYADKNAQPSSGFEGRVFHFPDQLRFGNASIKITKAKTSDSGTYKCYNIPVHTTYPQPELQSTISLTVGASPEPSVTMLDQTQTSALLRCVVRGASPKPEVVWMDSDGTTLRDDESKATKTTGNKFDTVLRITVTKTDNYTCVATQKEINHQINNTIFVRLNAAVPKPYVTIFGETNQGMLLQCEVFDASPKLKVFWKNSAGHDVSAKEQKTRTGGGYNIILQTTVTKTDYYRCVTTEGKKDDELHSEIFVRPYDNPRSSVSRLVPAAVLAVLGLVAAVVV
ncbi:CD276 antigen-like isoform X12 [Acanthochromis polyacanthus]|uniref:CD276 antigen-like isoform X11 n=1 Tax=Acanthochromis polyacanthus TaxID=80966 RepID=UPI0022343F16|nr:CD276 antigen-like isoform X11 [Acanthochromis polyacanthus]XP_051803891.1 CD276 antigen-like isoform X12 [Acanthochromis polyacanthus]